MTGMNMLRAGLLACLLLSAGVFNAGAFAAEERVIGVLEKTVKAGACAQITDALNEIYYIVKSDESDKMVADYAGKNIKVAITGSVESHEGDTAFFFKLKTLAAHKPKLPAKATEEPQPPASKAEPTVPSLNDRKK
jgi:hypothetical protein